LYNADELHKKLMGTIRSQYPNFNTFRMIFAGASGCGKSTVCASFPVSKKRIIFDGEDSMAFLDAGLEGTDVYTPRKQRFRMQRIAYPTIRDYATIFKEIETGKSDAGMLGIDNVTIFQDLIVDTLKKGAKAPKALRDLYSDFGLTKALPSDKQISKWEYQEDPSFWQSAKAIPKALIMSAMKNRIHLVVTTEEANVWENYGSPNAKVIGKKAKIWDVWFKYFDVVIMLDRNVNSTDPPRGKINPLQPKIRLQGFNPSWRMDWIGFIQELELALKRDEPDIPEELKVDVNPVYEEEAV
jgi:hypothetical protein